MSMMVCPDCGHEVSNRAPSCVHCGCPLGDAQKDQLLYAVALHAADYNDPKMIERIQQATGLSEEEAEELRFKVPVTLKRGLTYGEALALIHTFSSNTNLQIIRDEDADTPDNAVPLAQGTPHQAKPITFWTIVGAILTALALWTVASWILSLFFLAGIRF
ncbi:MAG: zinc ribbon domain-containing protein [Clostridia bacterium]|nr:zinc ribbon domain-containing protein [Clostridia bacterium]